METKCGKYNCYLYCQITNTFCKQEKTLLQKKEEEKRKYSFAKRGSADLM